MAIEQIAGQCEHQSVVIRRLLGQLKAGGLVESRRRVGGPAGIDLQDRRTHLLDVYDAVEPRHAVSDQHAARTEPKQECVCRPLAPNRPSPASYDRDDHVAAGRTGHHHSGRHPRGCAAATYVKRQTQD